MEALRRVVLYHVRGQSDIVDEELFVAMCTCGRRSSRSLSTILFLVGGNYPVACECSVLEVVQDKRKTERSFAWSLSPVGKRKILVEGRQIHVTKQVAKIEQLSWLCPDASDCIAGP